jgi:hypothetical protein
MAKVQTVGDVCGIATERDPRSALADISDVANT